MSKNRVKRKLPILSNSTAYFFGVIQPSGPLLESRAPVFQGPGNVDSICLKCNSVVIQGNAPNLDNAAVKCSTCGVTLDLTRSWTYNLPPILREDLHDLKEIKPIYRVESIWTQSPLANDLTDISIEAFSQIDKLQEPIPLILQHYTNDQGLFGMLKSNCIWATDIAYLNDSSEYIIATQIVEAYLEEKSKHVSEGCAEFLRRCQMEDLNNLDGGYFIACFCENRDLLSQWRGYGNAGSGYSMGISSRSIPTTPDLQLRRVIYDKQLQNNLVKDLVDNVCDLFESKFSQVPIADLSQALTDFSTFLRAHLMEIAVSFKHEAFREENEIRIIYKYKRKRDERNLKFRSAKDRMIPYMELPLSSNIKQLPLIPLLEITYGPIMHKQLAKKALIQFLQQNSYQHVDVFESEAPYRY